MLETKYVEFKILTCRLQAKSPVYINCIEYYAHTSGGKGYEVLFGVFFLVFFFFCACQCQSWLRRRVGLNEVSSNDGLQDNNCEHF